MRREVGRVTALVVAGLAAQAALANSGPGAAAAGTAVVVRHHTMLAAQPQGGDPNSTVIHQLEAPNWSGYIDIGGGGAVTAATGCWTVPSVSATAEATYSASWLGIDGATNGYLIQTGTEQDWSSPSGSAPYSAEYSAWWEIITPTKASFASDITMTITPGDVMCARISEEAPGSWSISLDDRSTGTPFSTVQAYGGPGESAEWIMESPTVCSSITEKCTVGPLADYGQATFDLATVNGLDPDLTPDDAVVMFTDPETPAISTPSVPNLDTDGFNVAYGAAAPPPPPSVSPDQGPAAGGQPVTLSGSGFETGAAVTFGTTPATGVTVVSASQLTAVTPPGSGTVTVTVTNPGGPPEPDLFAYTYVMTGAYTSLTPFRICDTRHATGTECSGSAADNRVGQGQTMAFQVTGVGGPGGQVVPSNAQAAVLNVTAISGSAGTYLTLFPSGSPLPPTSNLNVPAGVNQANLAVVPLGSGGQISIYNSAGAINVAVDVEGYFAAPAGSPSPGEFHAMPPLRICDTRAGTGTECSGTPLGAGQWTRVVLSGLPAGATAGTPSIPANGTAEAAALNLTAVSGTAATYLSVVPPSSADSCPSGAPSFSNLNVNAQTNLPNRVIVPLGPDQDVCVYNSLGSINFILDLNGWFGNGNEATRGALFSAITPTRICDTRAATGTECSGDSLSPGQVLTVPVAGAGSLPPASGSSPPVAVIANVTAVSGTAATYLTLYPAGGEPTPTASDLNVGPGQDTPNLVIVQLAASGINAGSIDLYNDLGTIDAIVDVQGWFS
jgi:hypothetical protein